MLTILSTPLMPDGSEGSLGEPKMGQRVLLLAGEGRGHGELDRIVTVWRVLWSEKRATA